MSVFGGYDMPLWFADGAREEHLSVLASCGLFDTSHMSVVRISGSDAFELLQWFFCRDISACVGPGKKPLTPGTCAYGVFLDESACVIDDGIVYSLDCNEFLLIVNAGMGERMVRRLTGRISHTIVAEIGRVLTCVTDMGIGRAGNRIYSIASPDKPSGFVPAGLSCGFVKVRTPLHEGDRITLQKGTRTIAVSVVRDIRPDRTARRPMKEMLDYKC